MSNNKVHDISDRYKFRKDDTDNCSGCDKEFKDGEYFTTVVVPSPYNDHEVTHIGLCDSCHEVAKEHNVL